MESVASKPIRRRSRESWNRLVEEYQSRKCTKKEFLNRHGISESALKYHLDRQNRNTSSFVSVEKADVSLVSQEVSITFPSGIKLSIRG